MQASLDALRLIVATWLHVRPSTCRVGGWGRQSGAQISTWSLLFSVSCGLSSQRTLEAFIYRPGTRAIMQPCWDGSRGWVRRARTQHPLRVRRLQAALRRGCVPFDSGEAREVFNNAFALGGIVIKFSLSAEWCKCAWWHVCVVRQCTHSPGGERRIARQ